MQLAFNCYLLRNYNDWGECQRRLLLRQYVFRNLVCRGGTSAVMYLRQEKTLQIWVCVQSFPSPRLVVIQRLECLVCFTIYLYGE